MKIRKSICVIVMCLYVIPIAFSNPASRINASFQLEEHVLTVIVEHSTKDVNKHWIDQIVVELNGKEIIQQTFGFQLDVEKQKGVYLIPEAKAGDEIVVVARCNVFGKKKVKIKIGSE